MFFALFLLFVCLFLGLFVCLFVCLVGCLFVCLFVWLFVCLFVCLFVWCFLTSSFSLWMDLHPAGTLLRVDHHLVDEMMKHAAWNHYKERLLTAGATHIVHGSLWAATSMQRTSANYWVFWLFSDFISYQQDSRQCLDRDSPTGQVRLMPTGTSRSTTMNLWQLGSYLEHFSSFLSLLLLTIAYSKNSIADSLDPYEWPVPWLLGHGPAEQWKTVASISCCQPWEPRSGTQDGKASLKVTSKSTNKAIANDWKNAWYAFVTSRIVEFFLQVWSYLSIWGPPKLPPSPSKNRKTNQPLTTWDGPDMHWPTECAGFGFWRYCFGACGSNVLKKYETIMGMYHHFRCVVRRGWISLHRSTVPGIITFLVTPTAIVSR